MYICIKIRAYMESINIHSMSLESEESVFQSNIYGDQFMEAHFRQ